ncbi:hypothetical protein BDV26DRAFT_269490 [Aspergillus bertholletiae]|uniref:Uncharacterized protein n=1 Tax=Aspergillus bertholletiae TaxID=1226010 RepID=A0A5N7B0Q4_9EURO|nr:hypothetical protein BDV26DRAFT_269490 [Aspergillus bertholletiae]
MQEARSRGCAVHHDSRTTTPLVDTITTTLLPPYLSSPMALSEYSIRLQHGIVGGFVPPSPSAILTLTKSAGGSDIAIDEIIRPNGRADLQQQHKKTLDSSNGQVQGLVTELYDILQDLPLESPTGSDDIYRLDTSIAWHSDDLEWRNGGPQGCVQRESDVQPSDQERRKFTRAVEIVKELVDMGSP